jgi:hypothetical protein
MAEPGSVPTRTTWFLTLQTVSRQPNRADGGADKGWIRFSEKSVGALPHQRIE